MTRIRLVEHAAGAPGMRWFGMGPDLKPSRGLLKLHLLLHKHAFWAQQRNTSELKKMLAGSNVVISLWRGKRLVGFGRATSDGIYRAVLWDVVVAGDLQGHGLGRQVIEALLIAPGIRNVERVYLMTTNSRGFYEQMGFERANNQQLLLLNLKNS